MKKFAPLSFWNRFTAIWQQDFLVRLMSEKTEGKTWGFWFLSNFIFTVIAVASGYIWLQSFLVDFPHNIQDTIDPIVVQLSDGSKTELFSLLENAEIEILSGDLFTKNIPDPSIIILNEATDTLEFYDSAQDLPASPFVVLIDSAEKKFDPTIVESFPAGFFLFSQKAVTKKTEGPKVELQEFYYADMGVQGVLNKATFLEFVAMAKEKVPPVLAIIGFVCLFLFLSVARLLSALWWSLIFWMIGSIGRVRNWSFEWSFLSVLHFKSITLPFYVLLLVAGVDFFGSVTLLFGVLFGMNFWYLKQSLAVMPEKES